VKGVADQYGQIFNALSARISALENLAAGESVETPGAATPSLN
jgi:hypothetical protein